jgi:hypothetical protein
MKSLKVWIFCTLILGIIDISGAQQSIINQGVLISDQVTHTFIFNETTKEITDNVWLKKEGHKFIFDTGAPLAISKEIQAGCNYKILHRVPVSDATDQKDTLLIVEIDTFKMGKIMIVNIPALVIDFKNSPIGCQGIEGIAGSNVARFFTVRFDLHQGKVILTNEPEVIRSFSMTNPGPVFIDQQSNANFEVIIDGSFKDTVYFDSGMSSFYDMNYVKASKLTERPDLLFHSGKGYSGQGVFGKGIQENLLRINTSITFSDFTLSDVVIESTRAKSRIGRELLNYGVMTIDYVNSLYHFKKYEKPSFREKPFFGVEFMSENNKLITSVVWDKTVPSQKGFHPDTEIVSINGKEVFDKNACEIDSVLQSELKKKKLHLEVLQNGTRKFFTLKDLKKN